MYITYVLDIYSPNLILEGEAAKMYMASFVLSEVRALPSGVEGRTSTINVFPHFFFFSLLVSLFFSLPGLFISQKGLS